jgi:hypothetical protein
MHSQLRTVQIVQAEDFNLVLAIRDNFNNN